MYDFYVTAELLEGWVGSFAISFVEVSLSLAAFVSSEVVICLVGCEASVGAPVAGVAFVDTAVSVRCACSIFASEAI